MRRTERRRRRRRALEDRFSERLARRGRRSRQLSVWDDVDEGLEDYEALKRPRASREPSALIYE